MLTLAKEMNALTEAVKSPAEVDYQTILLKIRESAVGGWGSCFIYYFELATPADALRERLEEDGFITEKTSDEKFEVSWYNA